MYSCEKLARGKNSGILKEGRARVNQIPEVSSDTLERRRSRFGDANVFFVHTEKDPERPVGKLYRSSMETEEVHK